MTSTLFTEKIKYKGGDSDNITLSSSSGVSLAGNLDVGSGTNKLGINTNAPHTFLDVAVNGYNSGRRLGVGYNDNIVSIYSHGGTGGLEDISVRGDNVYFYTDYDAGNPDGAQRMKIRSTGDISIQKNTTGFGNITSFGTVTLADDATFEITNGTHCGGSNHLFCYETGTGANCRFYFGYNKCAIETNLETGGIAWHNGDQDGATCVINNGTHTNTFKNRQGSSKTYKLMKVGVGATFNDTV